MHVENGMIGIKYESEQLDLLRVPDIGEKVPRRNGARGIDWYVVDVSHYTGEKPSVLLTAKPKQMVEFLPR